MKICITVGSARIDYEGDEQFIIDNLDLFIQAVSSLSELDNPADSQSSQKVIRETQYFTTSTIASKRKASTCSDLVLAAAAQMTISNGQDSFSRASLLREMQTAKAFYKKSMSSNLSKTLETLVKNGSLLQNGKDSYSLSNEKRLEYASIINS